MTRVTAIVTGAGQGFGLALTAARAAGADLDLLVHNAGELGPSPLPPLEH